MLRDYQNLQPTARFEPDELAHYLIHRTLEDAETGQRSMAVLLSAAIAVLESRLQSGDAVVLRRRERCWRAELWLMDVLATSAYNNDETEPLADAIVELAREAMVEMR